MKNFIIDMDGVLVKENLIIPGADKFINKLIEENRKFLLLTNNPVYTPRDLAHRLQETGIQIQEDQIFTSALATASFLHNQRPNGKAFVLGESGLTEAIHNIGASGIPIITVVNKIDLLGTKELERKIETLAAKIKNPIVISAIDQTNIELLKKQILTNLEDYVRVSFSIPLSNETMSFMSWIHEKSDVQKVNYFEKSVEVVLDSNPIFIEKVRKRVKKLHGEFRKTF